MRKVCTTWACLGFVWDCKRVCMWVDVRCVWFVQGNGCIVLVY